MGVRSTGFVRGSRLQPKKIPKVVQDRPSLGIFSQNLGHIDVEIGIFMRGIRLTWIMAAEMAKCTHSCFVRAKQHILLYHNVKFSLA